MTDRVRSTKLTFKGEKPKKKKRKHREEGVDDGDDGTDPQAWVQPDNATQVFGPTFILHPSSPSICITYDSTRSRIMLHTVTPESGASLLSLSPTEVSQVWVVTRVAGSSTINLRTAEGKFLSCDAHGLVSADREARGPQEEWTPVVLEGGMVAFMNVYEKYLSVDEVAGGSLSLRGDSEIVGFGERFWVKVQHEYKLKAGEEERKKEGVTGKRKIDEVEAKCVLPLTVCFMSDILSVVIHSKHGARADRLSRTMIRLRY
jgi:protein FRG1